MENGLKGLFSDVNSATARLCCCCCRIRFYFHPSETTKVERMKMKTGTNLCVVCKVTLPMDFNVCFVRQFFCVWLFPAFYVRALFISAVLRVSNEKTDCFAWWQNTNVLSQSSYSLSRKWNWNKIVKWLSVEESVSHSKHSRENWRQLLGNSWAMGEWVCEGWRSVDEFTPRIAQPEGHARETPHFDDEWW